MKRSKRRQLRRRMRHGLIGATAMVAGARTASAREHASVPSLPRDAHVTAGVPLAEIRRALEAFTVNVRPLSHPAALESAVRSYFTFRSAHPERVKNPLLYFVDYGLPSTEPRGYVLDMDALTIVEGPFTVAHGRGSSRNDGGVPTRFSNDQGSAATSLGLYLTDDVYEFSGSSGGRPYRSVGMRLIGLSPSFNDNAFARHVVAHGAPYVTPTRAGRSEGCPAMEPARAKRLLPQLANGGMVFLFAPDEPWLAGDPWLH